MRRALIVVGAIAIGAAAGAIWTWAQPERFRADARVLVRPSGARILPAVAALAESSVVASNVAQTLHLSAPPQLSATTHDGGLLTVSVEQHSRERARQVDAEAIVVLAQKVDQRFPPRSVTVLDPAHVAHRTSPTPGRNFIVAVLGGLGAGIALALLLPRSSPVGTRSLPHRDVGRRLQARLNAVQNRERALARRAAELALRERDLEERRLQLELAARAPGAQPEPEPEPGAEPQPDVHPAQARAHTVDANGPWNIETLEDLVDERAAGDPERRDELAAYVIYLREYADASGRLPERFDALIADVFSD